MAGAYLKIFELLQQGRGPTGAFRPFLYRVISTLAVDTYRVAPLTSDQLDQIPDLAQMGPWEDATFDLNAVSDAFATLPERWQEVLWYTEVEGMPPRDVAPLLGIKPNAVSALAVRAREGLQSAWVEAHLTAQVTAADCQTTREHLQRYQRGKLTARLQRSVDAHLEECEACSAAAAELFTLNRQLALVLSIVLIGSVTTAALGALLRTGAVGAAAVGGAGSASVAAMVAAPNPATALLGAGSIGATGAAAGAGGAGGAGATGGAGGLAGGVLATIISVTAVAVLGGGVLGAVALVNSGVSPSPPQQEAPVADAPPAPNNTKVDGQAPSSADATTTSPTARAEGDASTEVDGRVLDDPPAESLPAPPVTVPPTQPGTNPGTNPGGGGTNPGGNGGGPVQPPTDPNLIPWLSVGTACFIEQSGPGSVHLSAEANAYGVIQVRITQSGGTPVTLVDPQFDPANPGSLFVNGVFTDPYGNTFTQGFVTGTDPAPTNFWITPSLVPLSQWGGLLVDAPLDSVVVEMRLLRPSGNYSPWQTVSSPTAPVAHC